MPNAVVTLPRGAADTVLDFWMVLRMVGAPCVARPPLAVAHESASPGPRRGRFPNPLPGPSSGIPKPSDRGVIIAHTWSRDMTDARPRAEPKHFATGARRNKATR